jgi:hypothetical protein
VPTFTPSVRVTRETAPEEISNDEASKERLLVARKAIAQVDEQLAPLVAVYENEKSRGEEVNKIRKKIDELKAKADEAERRYASPRSTECNDD